MPRENVFLFVPNVIATRFGAMMDMLTDRCATMCLLVNLALVYPSHSFLFQLSMCVDIASHWLHLHSALLDAFDGHAARALDQSTRFGAMMDMLTDRCATMCLLVNLALVYPSYSFLFQLSMCVDIASHWLHLHSSTITGSTSHKSIDLSGNPILRIYYTSKPVLFVMCAGNELFFCLLFLLHHIQEPAAWLYWLQGLCVLC
ncbi:CDP-diacylglycerol--inositol 3-phosphatidyltransferase [Liparis tanakae]|uniref:CDP-diacylglycerol--inositol 3-phosphatidyltransferase n=1 Tax=Liparis tanakae TaxID=230148 RepID=A0A4Z2FXI7_9TELE|nr:CDP-diacylglycerol--inositol 3-phosphatidyltransferase [Liparis tanakae]